MWPRSPQKGEKALATLPFQAHGDTLPVVRAEHAKEGPKDNRQVIGSKLIALLLFDSCAQVPVVIRGLDVSQLPAPEVFIQHNLRMNFVMAKFSNLVISFTGGDYGNIRYSATASGVEFISSQSK